MTARCFLFHDWSRWRQYVQHGHRYWCETGWTPYVETYQFRTCERCGKVQDSYVSSHRLPPSEAAA